MCVLHRCDIPSCVNPDHLFIGTHAQNMRDRDAKGRSRGAAGELNSHAKLTRSQVADIRVSIKRHAELAKEFGVTAAHIQNIRANRKWEKAQ
jgi:hypothetical protein